LSVEVRPCADRSELERAFMIIGQYFGMESGFGESAVRFERVLPTERMLAAWDGGEIVGGTAALPFRLSVPGGSVACAGTSVVGVSPTHRRRGVLRAMMQAHLSGARERGDAVAALWASDEGIYGRFGYGRAAFAGEIALPREYGDFGASVEPSGRARLIEPDEAAELLPPIWDELARQRPGMILRSREWWEDRPLADPSGHRYGAGPKRIVVLEDGGTPGGYAIYRHRFESDGGTTAAELVVVEAVGAKPAAVAAVWRYLLDVDWVATITASLLPPDHPLFFLLAQPRRMRYRMGDGLWLRLLDVGDALAARTYPQEGELVLELRDALCPWNEGRWLVGGGGAERTTALADLSLDVGALGAAYLGGVRFASLAQNGSVAELRKGAVERADGIFRHGPHPWCPEIF
jgi:predicted acetyltransferase